MLNGLCVSLPCIKTCDGNLSCSPRAIKLMTPYARRRLFWAQVDVSLVKRQQDAETADQTMMLTFPDMSWVCSPVHEDGEIPGHLPAVLAVTGPNCGRNLLVFHHDMTAMQYVPGQLTCRSVGLRWEVCKSRVRKFAYVHDVDRKVSS